MRLLFRELVDDPEDLGTRLEGGEGIRDARGVQTIVWRIEHGPDGGSQRHGRWRVRCQVDADPGAGHAHAHIGLVLAEPGGDQGNAKTQGDTLEPADTPAAQQSPLRP
jgi:hypothetical protein